MFLDPFEKKQAKADNKKKVKIIADIHEKDSTILLDLKLNKEIDLEIKPLKIGDYLIGETIIERKTTNDFISSMLSKRLSYQLKNMQLYPGRLLIIEGNLEEFYPRKGENKLNPNAIRGYILSIIANYETPIIFTANSRDTANYLVTLAKQQNKKIYPSAMHARIPKTLEEQKKYILEAFPKIGPRKAELLLQKFKTLKNIFNATEEDLKEVLKNRAREFRDLLDS